jgi:hypothetical protein
MSKVCVVFNSVGHYFIISFSALAEAYVVSLCHKKNNPSIERVCKRDRHSLRGRKKKHNSKNSGN